MSVSKCLVTAALAGAVFAGLACSSDQAVDETKKETGAALDATKVGADKAIDATRKAADQKDTYSARSGFTTTVASR